MHDDFIIAPLLHLILHLIFYLLLLYLFLGLLGLIQQLDLSWINRLGSTIGEALETGLRTLCDQAYDLASTGEPSLMECSSVELGEVSLRVLLCLTFVGRGRWLRLTIHP